MVGAGAARKAPAARWSRSVTLYELRRLLPGRLELPFVLLDFAVFLALVVLAAVSTALFWPAKALLEAVFGG